MRSSRSRPAGSSSSGRTSSYERMTAAGKGRSDLFKMSLGALGVVYGDIGTSPLYAVKECFAPPHGAEVTHDNVLGVMSLFVWSLTLVIVIKYLTFVMRADNGGEGGTFALIALIDPKRAEKTKRGTALILLGVLGAVEGLKEATHVFEPYVVYISIGVIVGLFMIQKRGTGGVGAIFGPAML